MRFIRPLILCVFAVAAVACGGKSANVVPAFAPQMQSREAENAVSYHVIHAFAGGKEGSFPNAAVLPHDGVLYGTTALGGSNKGNCVNYFCGTAYTIAPTGKGFAVIYQFLGIPNGDNPYTKLAADAQGALYGSSLGGPYPPNGSIYKLSGSKTGFWKKSVLYSLGGGADGDDPSALVIDAKTGNAFGTSAGIGGNDCCGTVFEINVSGKGYTVLYHFTGGTNGANPEGPLVEDIATGTFYGATIAGGKTTTACDSGCGLIYKLVPSGGKYKFSVVYRFQGGMDGAFPYGALGIISGKTGNTIYGAATQGGLVQCSEEGSVIGCGVVFSINPKGKPATLHLFGGSEVNDGENPSAGVTLVGQTIYGTTTTGGTAGYGTVYSVTTSGKQYAVLHDFGGFGQGHDGATPQGELSYSNGTLFGVTNKGGGSKSCTEAGAPVGCGVLYSITP
jgi:uncharacterized repeat protein (TIGR03803 family)